MIHRNLDYLRINRKDLYQKLANIKQLALSDPIHIQKNELPYANIEIRTTKKTLHLHDSADPWSEASQIVQTVKEQIMNKEHHILFFGVGMAYHIRSFVSKFPNVTYSIYEPSLKVLAALLEEVPLEDLNIGLLRNLFVGFDPVRTVNEIKSFIYQTPRSFTIVTLPSYQELYSEIHTQFISITKQIIERKQRQLHVNLHFEKMWVYNALRNFSYTINNPNIFDYKEHFKDKPVMLLAAGPSLEEEIDHIRTIKQRGSAYIFTVGSAINVLINHQIEPDAAFTYDPTPINQIAFKRALEENKASFPLIYGSTVGENTLEPFPGPKVYIPTTQDPILAFYQKKESEYPVINDAPSIAVITLQVLIALQCSNIILVGQNLAYRDDQYYCNGIPYTDGENAQRITVPSVTGKEILTNDSLNMMRKEMEHYIQLNPGITVVNTTKDGAAIKGTEYKDLSIVMEQLSNGSAVIEDWVSKPRSQGMDVQHLVAQKEKMIEHRQRLQDLFLALRDALGILEQTQTPQHFQNFDSIFKLLQQNLFFRYFLQPMNRAEYEILFSNIVTIQTETSLKNKATLLVSLFGSFFQNCYTDFNNLQPYFNKLNQTIDHYVMSREEYK